MHPLNRSGFARYQSLIFLYVAIHSNRIPKPNLDSFTDSH